MFRTLCGISSPPIHTNDFNKYHRVVIYGLFMTTYYLAVTAERRVGTIAMEGPICKLSVSAIVANSLGLTSRPIDSIQTAEGDI